MYVRAPALFETDDGNGNGNASFLMGFMNWPVFRLVGSPGRDTPLRLEEFVLSVSWLSLSTVRNATT